MMYMRRWISLWVSKTEKYKSRPVWLSIWISRTLKKQNKTKQITKQNKKKQITKQKQNKTKQQQQQQQQRYGYHDILGLPYLLHQWLNVFWKISHGSFKYFALCLFSSKQLVRVYL